MNLINGKKIADGILEELKKEINEKRIKPCLGVVLVGHDSASHLYVNKKKEAAQRIGVEIKEEILPEDVLDEEILKVIDNFNQDNRVNGILVQMPLPKGINSDKIIKAINLGKDVDGFLPESGFSPPFVLAIERALEEAGGIENKKTIALVNSEVFGRALGAKLGIKYKLWINTFGYRIAEYDIIISALGRPGIIKGDMIKSGVILIDGGISKKNGKIVGDVDQESVQQKAGWLSPVPGGLGPMTVAFLLRNLVWNIK